MPCYHTTLPRLLPTKTGGPRALPSHTIRTIPYESCLSSTIQAFSIRITPERAESRRGPTMTQGLPLKRSPKQPFQKRRKHTTFSHVNKEAKARTLFLFPHFVMEIFKPFEKCSAQPAHSLSPDFVPEPAALFSQSLHILFGNNYSFRQPPRIQL
jgi:hypothetical protein